MTNIDTGAQFKALLVRSLYVFAALHIAVAGWAVFILEAQNRGQQIARLSALSLPFVYAGMARVIEVANQDPRAERRALAGLAVSAAVLILPFAIGLAVGIYNHTA